MAANEHPDISNEEFAQFQKLIYKIAGISLADSKKVLLVGRDTAADDGVGIT